MQENADAKAGKSPGHVTVRYVTKSRLYDSGMQNGKREYNKKIYLDLMQETPEREIGHFAFTKGLPYNSSVERLY